MKLLFGLTNIFSFRGPKYFWWVESVAPAGLNCCCDGPAGGEKRRTQNFNWLLLSSSNRALRGFYWPAGQEERCLDGMATLSPAQQESWAPGPMWRAGRLGKVAKTHRLWGAVPAYWGVYVCMSRDVLLLPWNCRQCCSEGYCSLSYRVWLLLGVLYWADGLESQTEWSLRAALLDYMLQWNRAAEPPEANCAEVCASPAVCCLLLCPPMSSCFSFFTRIHICRIIIFDITPLLIYLP